MLGRHEARLGRRNIASRTGIGGGEGAGAFVDAEAGEELALGGERLDGQAGAAGDIGQRFEIDMRGEIDLARGVENVGVGVAATMRRLSATTTGSSPPASETLRLA